MTEPNQKNSPAELADEQLAEVSGGRMVKIIAQPIAFKRCAADTTHIYAEVLDACPICGSKEFTRA